MEEFEGLTEFEKQGLKVSIADLLVETPSSDVAVLRWKRAAAKLTGSVREVAVKVIADITAATLKDKMGLH